MDAKKLFEYAPTWAQWAAIQPSGKVAFSDKRMVLSPNAQWWEPDSGAELFMENEYLITGIPEDWMFTQVDRDRYRTRTTEVTVHRNDAHFTDSMATRIRVTDDGGGEYLELEQLRGVVKLELGELERIVQVARTMIAK